jgi:hypothetical protein
MGEAIIISTVVLSILTALGGIFIKLHINKCKCGNINCECDNNSDNSNDNKDKKTLKTRISEIFKSNTINTTNI